MNTLQQRPKANSIRSAVTFLGCAATLLVVTVVPSAKADLLNYYNFGTATSGNASFPMTSAGGTEAGTLTTNFPTSGVTLLTGTTVNAANGSMAGGALTPANNANNGSFLTFSLSLAGYNAPVITYAAQRTGTGFTTESFSYSTDGGANFIQFADVTGIPASFAIQTVNFSSVGALVDNANAQFRITFTGATSAGGNNRLDNFQFNATAVPEPGTLLGGFLLVGVLGWSQRLRLAGVAGWLRGSCAA